MRRTGIKRSSKQRAIHMGCAVLPYLQSPVEITEHGLNDESEPYRRMVMETIEKIVANLGASDIVARLEELLIDGIFYAFQEQTSDDANVMLNEFGAVVNA